MEFKDKIKEIAFQQNDYNNNIELEEAYKRLKYEDTQEKRIFFLLLRICNPLEIFSEEYNDKVINKVKQEYQNNGIEKDTIEWMIYVCSYALDKTYKMETTNKEVKIERIKFKQEPFTYKGAETSSFYRLDHFYIYFLTFIPLVLTILNIIYNFLFYKQGKGIEILDEISFILEIVIITYLLIFFFITKEFRRKITFTSLGIINCLFFLVADYNTINNYVQISFLNHAFLILFTVLFIEIFIKCKHAISLLFGIASIVFLIFVMKRNLSIYEFGQLAFCIISGFLVILFIMLNGIISAFKNKNTFMGVMNIVCLFIIQIIMLNILSSI